jgi:hypothetical protein
MSLMKLLSMGRSFTAGVEMGRYRMAREGTLPSFGSARRFHQAPPPMCLTDTEVQTELPEPELFESVAEHPPELQLPSPAPNSKPGPSAVDSTARVEATGLTEMQSASEARVFGAVKGWLQRRTSSHAWAGSAKPAKPRQPMPRALLSLDRVHVVRNDLTDADFEVLPLRDSRVMEGTVEVLVARSKSVLPGMAWSQAAERLFRSGRARI